MILKSLLLYVQRRTVQFLLSKMDGMGQMRDMQSTSLYHQDQPFTLHVMRDTFQVVSKHIFVILTVNG